MLAVDFLEFLCGFCEFLLVQKSQRLVVNDVRRLIGQQLIVLFAAPKLAEAEASQARTAGERQAERQDHEHPEAVAKPLLRSLLVTIGTRTCEMRACRPCPLACQGIAKLARPGYGANGRIRRDYGLKS